MAEADRKKKGKGRDRGGRRSDLGVPEPDVLSSEVLNLHWEGKDGQMLDVRRAGGEGPLHMGVNQDKRGVSINVNGETEQQPDQLKEAADRFRGNVVDGFIDHDRNIFGKERLVGEGVLADGRKVKLDGGRDIFGGAHVNEQWGPDASGTGEGRGRDAGGLPPPEAPSAPDAPEPPLPPK
ncbi:MAG TPA: hypothetical protein VF995_06060 [Actinomycetota bacterium]